MFYVFSRQKWYVLFSLALVLIAAAGSMLSCSIKPTNGLLGTDDITVYGFGLQYTKLLLAS